jgi:hypothetical protein
MFSLITNIFRHPLTITQLAARKKSWNSFLMKASISSILYPKFPLVQVTIKDFPAILGRTDKIHIVSRTPLTQTSTNMFSLSSIPSELQMK